MRTYIVQVKIVDHWIDYWYTDNLKGAKKLRDLKKIHGYRARVLKEIL